MTTAKRFGIDGCKGGWVVAEGGDSLTFRILPLDRLRELLCEAERGEAVVVIDMPIGLPERDRRPCDAEARKVVGPKRATSVFPVPCRAAVHAQDEDPSVVNHQHTGRKLSRQSLGILKKIGEVDLLLRPALQASVREAHPEVTFAVLKGEPLVNGKKTKDGERERLAVLERVGIVFDPHDVRQRLGRGQVAVDDIIDAAACLDTARRIVGGCARVLGGERDARRLRMEIVA